VFWRGGISFSGSAIADSVFCSSTDNLSLYVFGGGIFHGTPKKIETIVSSDFFGFLPDRFHSGSVKKIVPFPSDFCDEPAELTRIAYKQRIVNEQFNVAVQRVAREFRVVGTKVFGSERDNVLFSRLLFNRKQNITDKIVVAFHVRDSTHRLGKVKSYTSALRFQREKCLQDRRARNGEEGGS
jgi:hypothetical protein